MPARPSSSRRQQRRPRQRPAAPVSSPSVPDAPLEVPPAADAPAVVAASTRARRATRLAIEPVDYTAEHAIARRDLTRITLLSAVLVVAMLALWLSGVV